MAYGAILGQMPQIDGIPAVIETYPIAIGNTITQGDVVDVVDGQIQKTLAPQANVETVLDTLSLSNQTSVTSVGQNKAVIFIPYSTNWGCRLYDCTTAKVVGTASPPGGGGNQMLTSDKLSDQYVVVGTTNSDSFLGYICTISSDTVSISQSYYIQDFTVGTGGTINNGKVIALSSNSFLAVYNRSGLRAKVCTVSGASISAGAEFPFSSNTSASYISATRLPDSGTTRRVCICYRDGGDSYKGKAVIVSINANNNIIWGTPMVFESNAIAGALSCCASGNDVVVTFNTDSPRTQYVELLIVSETKISNTSAISTNILSQSLASIVECKDSTYVLTFCKAPSPYTGVSFVITRSSDTLNIGDPFYFSSVFNGSSTPINQNQVLVVYSNAGNSNYGTATILTVSGDQIAGSFLDSSKDAIALQDGTSGQSIEVIYSGITYADWVTEGQTITSDGVYGAGLLDGVLQVWSKDRPLGTQIITGSYVGTGKYGPDNPNSLTFDFPVAYIIFVGQRYSAGFSPLVQSDYLTYNNPVLQCFAIGNTYEQNAGPYMYSNSSSAYAKVSSDRKTVYWYNIKSENQQLNENNYTYYYIAF